jgi:hypothetical protein
MLSERRGPRTASPGSCSAAPNPDVPAPDQYRRLQPACREKQVLSQRRREYKHHELQGFTILIHGVGFQRRRLLAWLRPHLTEQERRTLWERRREPAAASAPPAAQAACRSPSPRRHYRRCRRRRPSPPHCLTVLQVKHHRARSGSSIAIHIRKRTQPTTGVQVLHWKPSFRCCKQGHYVMLERHFLSLTTAAPKAAAANTCRILARRSGIAHELVAWADCRTAA